MDTGAREASAMNGQVIAATISAAAGVQKEDAFPMDQAVIDTLPHGLTYRRVEHSGESSWTLTGKLTATDADGKEVLFFLKLAFDDDGGVMLRGESESAQIIHELSPGLIPQPFGFGRYKSASRNTYFLLAEFIDMEVGKAPDPVKLAQTLSDLHLKSTCPIGQFGFHVVTCDGSMQNTVDWQDSWPDFFARLLSGISKIDVENNGPWSEMERATKQVIIKVIPRLLSNLQWNGQPIKPCLIHGDLWEPNIGINEDTGALVLFDVSSYFAHNEMELGPWRADFCSYLWGEAYTGEYLKFYGASEPVSEFEDRLRLYSLKGLLNFSAGHPDSPARLSAYNSMCYLCEKYAPIGGIDKYDPKKDASVTGARIHPTFDKSANA